MRVLLVSSSFFPKIDGSTRCVYDHARKLAESGHMVYLVTRGVGGAPREELLEGIHVVRSNASFRAGSAFNRARLILEQITLIFGLHRKIGFDVVHVHGYTAGLAALPLRYVFGVPMFITTHGTEFLWPRDVWWKSPAELKLNLIFEKFVLSRSDIVIAQSEGVKRYMLDLYGEGIQSKVRIVPTGVDHVKFHIEGELPGDDKVLFVGTLSEVKGLTCLLKAFGEVHAEFPSAKLILVGTGPSGPKYRQLVGSMGLADSVQFTGAVRDDGRLIQFYREASVVVLPSNVGGPVSCTLLEGMSCGRAVISTNVPGGIPDVLDGAGLLMRRGDDVELASYFRRLFSDREFLDELGESARSKVLRCYTLDTMVNQLLSLYTMWSGVGN